MFAVLAAHWTPTANAQRMMRDFESAVKNARGMLKGALGYDGPQLSRFVSCEQSSMLARLADDEAVERELIRIRAERYGLRVLDDDMAAVLDEAVTRKRMARMSADERTER